MDKEERISRRAYDIWCAEGWPKGRDQEHWEQARREIEHETVLDLTGAAQQPSLAIALAKALPSGPLCDRAIRQAACVSVPMDSHASSQPSRPSVNG